MISYLQGILFRRYEDRVVVLVGGVGYEIHVPQMVRGALADQPCGESGATIKLEIMYYDSDRQNRPVLIGFNSEIEREFFERFISVEGIGPMAAVKALTLPVPTVARAIESKDTKTLRSLAGIGARTAEKIVASLNGRVGKFCLMPEVEEGAPAAPPDAELPVSQPALRREVELVLSEQMGYRLQEAQRMVSEALRRRPEIDTAEQLFEEVYRARKQAR